MFSSILDFLKNCFSTSQYFTTKKKHKSDTFPCTKEFFLILNFFSSYLDVSSHSSEKCALSPGKIFIVKKFHLFSYSEHVPFHFIPFRTRMENRYSNKFLSESSIFSFAKNSCIRKNIQCSIFLTIQSILNFEKSE